MKSFPVVPRAALMCLPRSNSQQDMYKLRLFLLLCVAIHSVAQETSLITTTTQFYAALSNPRVTTLLFTDTLIVNPLEWGPTVAIGRSVVLSATPERLSSRTYVLLDFNNTVMMFGVDPGYVMKFIGLELFNHYDMVGPTVKALRQSVGATALFENCIQRRRAGLPYEAALVNMVNATRPPGVSGPQVCFRISNFTFMSTRSPAPIVAPNAVSMLDYSTVVTADSSLAYQNLYYGGYTYTTDHSYYIVDNFVSFACMAVRPGTECVTLLLQQLDAPPPPPPGAKPATSGSSNVTTIVVAVVVPTVSAIVVLVVAIWVLRGRRARKRSLYGSSSGRPMSDIEAAGGKGRVPSSMRVAAAHGHEGGCVFLGLEENQQLPEWSPLAADVDEDEVDDEDDRRSLAEGPFKGGPSASSILVAQARSPMGRGSAAAAAAQQHAGHTPSASEGRGSGLLQPALSTQMGKEGTEGPGGAAGAVAGGGGDKDPGASADRGPSGASGEKPGGEGGAGGPKESPGLSGAGSHSHNSGTPDMQAELGRLAQELRANVKDQPIKLEAVIGAGSFGTVYRGTWQGLPVAIKTVVFSASDESRRRALQEAALCASISHPNVVATYSSELQPLGALGGDPSSTDTAANNSGSRGSAEKQLSQILEWRLYIVQEYADAGPLRKLYGNKAIWPSPGVVNMPAVVALALGIARALTHLHSKRIIHGDLNPNNVLLKRDTAEPSGYAVKVGDFGLSVMLPHNRTHLSNLRMGTMFYMCPAVVMKGQVGPSSDVFSLGVMLWELYHGRRAGIRTDQGPRYSSIFPAFPPSCPEAYSAVALHCLQRQPQNRPSAALVEAHLEQLLASLLAAHGSLAIVAAAMSAAAAECGGPAAEAVAAAVAAAVATSGSGGGGPAGPHHGGSNSGGGRAAAAPGPLGSGGKPRS